MQDCIFCKIVKSEIPTKIVYEDNQVVVFPDHKPKAPIHLLIVTKKHIPSIKELTKSDDELVVNMIHLLPKLASEHGLAAGFKTAIHTGRQGGQEIDHLHFHLMGG